MATDLQSPKLPSPRTDAIRGVILLVVVVLGLSFLLRGCDFDDDGADAAAPAVTAPGAAPTSSAPPSVETDPVPDLTGLKFDVAQRQLPGWDWEAHDLSPRDRHQYDDDNWTVVTTRPAPGELVADGTPLHLFVLKNSEAAWFAAHPTMPAVPVDVPVTDLTGAGQLFGGVEELIDYRFAPGELTSSPADRRLEPVRLSEGVVDNPAVEPAEEREAQAALDPGYGHSGTLTVGSLPGEGISLRTGRLISLIIRNKPLEPVPAAPEGTSSTGGTSVSGSYSHSDDDVNVPGWLCPTRFC